MKGGEEGMLSFMPQYWSTCPSPQQSQQPLEEATTACFDLSNIIPTIGVHGTTSMDAYQPRPVVKQMRDQAGRFTGGWNTKSGSGRGPGGAYGGCAPKDESEKTRRKEIKLQQRKQRNKEAARRSNLNKKIHRSNLEKKSVELWEQKLQLQQDIRELTNRLSHIHQVYTGMHHVCQGTQQPASLAAY